MTTGEILGKPSHIWAEGEILRLKKSRGSVKAGGPIERRDYNDGDGHRGMGNNGAAVIRREIEAVAGKFQ